jgi:hypothetical protein
MDNIMKYQYDQSPTYKWTSLGNLDSSGGTCPLIELLFMWLLTRGKEKKEKDEKKEKYKH